MVPLEIPARITSATRPARIATSLVQNFPPVRMRGFIFPMRHVGQTGSNPVTGRAANIDPRRGKIHHQPAE